MAPVDHKTMFEIYRETDYNRAFRCVFFTDLDEHNRGKEIARAAAGETIFSGFIARRPQRARPRGDPRHRRRTQRHGRRLRQHVPREIQRRLGDFLV
jgi:hypothetical protein